MDGWMQKRRYCWLCYLLRQRHVVATLCCPQFTVTNNIFLNQLPVLLKRQGYDKNSIQKTSWMDGFLWGLSSFFPIHSAPQFLKAKKESLWQQSWGTLVKCARHYCDPIQKLKDENYTDHSCGKCLNIPNEVKRVSHFFLKMAMQGKGRLKHNLCACCRILN